MKFKLEKIIEIKDPNKCHDCLFEIENDSMDLFCAAMDENVESCLLRAVNYNSAFFGDVEEVRGDLGPNGERPPWCPLKEV